MASKRYTTLEDHWNMMFGSTLDDDIKDPAEDRRAALRPVSWHPGCRRPHDPAQSPMDSVIGGNYSEWTARRSCPNQDIEISPYLNQYSGELQSQLPHFGYSSSNVTPAVDSYTTSPSWDEISRGMQSSVEYTSFPHHHSHSSNWSVPDWVQMTQSTAQSSAQNSDEFLPIQQPSSSKQDSSVACEDGDSVDDDKVLVGMGLYDPPDGYDSWFSAGPQLSTGKGLKLEETWEPPEAVDDEDDYDDDSDADVDIEDDAGNAANNEDDASIDEDAAEEQKPQPPTPATLPVANPIDAVPMAAATSVGITTMPSKPEPQAWPMAQGQQFSVNMSGRSFLFDEDETYTNEWWFHQLKQPSAQDAGIGYGWL
jgi:hypothetical protein